MNFKRRLLLQKEDGVTLVEVLAAIVIISIILTSVFSLLTFTNKTAVSNNSKLVSINLAKASIERMKVDPESYINFDDVTEAGVTYTKDNCAPVDCDALYQMKVNNQDYELEITASQNLEEEQLQLINVVVTVSLDERNIESTVEGYVNYASYE